MFNIEKSNQAYHSASSLVVYATSGIFCGLWILNQGQRSAFTQLIDVCI